MVPPCHIERAVDAPMVLPACALQPAARIADQPQEITLAAPARMTEAPALSNPDSARDPSASWKRGDFPARYHVLASDYDGTLARHGQLTDGTKTALERLKATGRKVLMVTGRRVDDLLTVCPDLSPFDCIVAENGAVLYFPATREFHPLAESPPPIFADMLRERGVPDVATGKVIVATWSPYETVVLQVIRDLHLEMQVIFNKGAVMVLPSGVNKGTGLLAALAKMRLSGHNVVAVGDAENDHALLSTAECGVAVGNALPMLKERADLVTKADHGEGVEEVAQRLIRYDLADLTPAITRHDIPIGLDPRGRPVTLPAYGANILLAGTSGAGKSTFATAFLEGVAERDYQFCILDPEGDYSELPKAVVVGSPHAAPVVEDVMTLLAKPEQSAIVNLVGVALDDRPRFFDVLMPRLKGERAAVGRPHWIVVDEAHHFSPRQASGDTATPAMGQTNLVFITVHPEHVSRAWLQRMDAVVVIGVSPAETLAELARALGVEPPRDKPAPLPPGEALLWWPREPKRGLVHVRTTPPQTERHRHLRKYAEGALPPERSFYFRGPEGKLNLRAQNLNTFLQMGEGVDEETWRFHLAEGDYSRWIGDVIHDEELAAEVAALEKEPEALKVEEARQRLRGAIERRYTVAGPS